MFRIARSRPLLSLTTSTITASTTYAYYVEHRSKKEVLDQVHVLPREYSRGEIIQFWQQRPITVISRIGSIASELIPVIGKYVYDFKICARDSEELQQQHAVELKAALTRLGPAFVS